MNLAAPPVPQFLSWVQHSKSLSAKNLGFFCSHQPVQLAVFWGTWGSGFKTCLLIEPHGSFLGSTWPEQRPLPVGGQFLQESIVLQEFFSRIRLFFFVGFSPKHDHYHQVGGLCFFF